MIAIGRYLLLFISLSGLTLSNDDRFSDDGELFLKDAHNTKRTNWEISYYSYLGNKKCFTVVFFCKKPIFNHILVCIDIILF